MKKAISLLLALVMCLSLCACGGGNDAPETTEPLSEATQVPTTEANTEPETSIPVEVVPSLDTSWVLDYYVDEFGDKTDTPHIMCVIEGDFSNTATMSSDLTVVVFYDFKSEFPFSFRLLEYGDHKATYLSDDEITLKMKVDGEVTTSGAFGLTPDEVRTADLYGLVTNGDLVFTSEDFTVGDLLHTLLAKDAPDVRCIITIGDSKYNFTIPSAGFSDSYKAMYDYYYNDQGE